MLEEEVLVHHLFSLLYTEFKLILPDSASETVRLRVIFCICLRYFWCTTGVYSWDPSLEKANQTTSSLMSNSTFSQTVKSGSIPTCSQSLEDPHGL